MHRDTSQCTRWTLMETNVILLTFSTENSWYGPSRYINCEQWIRSSCWRLRLSLVGMIEFLVGMISFSHLSRAVVVGASLCLFKYYWWDCLHKVWGPPQPTCMHATKLSRSSIPHEFWKNQLESNMPLCCRILSCIYQDIFYNKILGLNPVFVIYLSLTILISRFTINNNARTWD